MSASNIVLPDHLPEQAFAAVIRNLLLYGLLFHLFALEAASLFSAVSESERVAAVSSDEGNLYNQLLLPVAFIAVCVLVYAYGIPVRVLLAAMMPMGPFFIAMGLSAVWSEYPELTIRRVSHEVTEATTLALLACCFSSATVLLRTFFRAFLAIGCLDLFSAIIFPDSLTSLGFAGIHGHKNLAGQFFFVALPVYALGTLYKEVSGSRLLGLLSLVCGVAMLVLTESKTSVGAVIVGFSSLLLTRGLSHRDPTFHVPVFLSCVFVLLCTVAALINWSPGELLEMLIGDPTLTGRDGIWRYAVSKFDASPIVGAGYGAIWQVGPSIQSALKEMGILLVFNEAHNGYLEIAAQLGIVGIFCLLIFLIATLRNALFYWATIDECKFSGAGLLTIYIFWGLALSNITESLYFQAGLGSFGALIFFGAFVAGCNQRSTIMSTANAAQLASHRYTAAGTPLV
jgi:exopolysaccharide production protein ExoQ